jgi:hypothetical protein
MDDERRGALLREAFQKFRNSLDDGEKMDFTRATASDVLERVRLMDEEHRRSSTSRRAVDAIYPLVQFLDRNSRAVDCLIQVQPLPSAIIWAMCRILIEVSQYWTTFHKYSPMLRASPFFMYRWQFRLRHTTRNSYPWSTG